MNKRVVTIGAVALLSGMVWGQREVTRFNDGWKFAAFGEQADGTMVAEPEAMSEGFEDAAWRTVRLPHDWGVESPFRMDVNGSQGRLPYFGSAGTANRFDCRRRSMTALFFWTSTVRCRTRRSG